MRQVIGTIMAFGGAGSDRAWPRRVDALIMVSHMES